MRSALLPAANCAGAIICAHSFSCCNLVVFSGAGTRWRAIREIEQNSSLAICAVGTGLILGTSSLIAPLAHGAQPSCSVEKLQGRYVFSGQGSNLHYGAFDFDGAGKVDGRQTSLRYKTSVQRESLNGTYVLEADCTGTMTLEGQPGGTAHWDLYVTSDGKKGRMIRTDSGTTGVRTFEQ